MDTYYDGCILYSIQIQGQHIGKLEQSRESLFALLSLLWAFQKSLYLYYFGGEMLGHNLMYKHISDDHLKQNFCAEFGGQYSDCPIEKIVPAHKNLP